MTIKTENSMLVNENQVGLISLLAASPEAKEDLDDNLKEQNFDNAKKEKVKFSEENVSISTQKEGDTCKTSHEINNQKNSHKGKDHFQVPGEDHQNKHKKKRIMGLSKDTSSIKSLSPNAPLKSCILISKGKERISVKKAKSVHFADSLGKPLKSIKTLQEQEDYLDLSFLSLRSTTRRTFPVDIFKNNYKNSIGSKNISRDYNKLVNFKQPVKTKDFQTRVENENVCLENVVFREYGIFATITVKNISYHKDITVRYTTDKWDSFEVIHATYVPGSSTGTTDTFSFEILPKDAKEEQVEIQFAISFAANGHTYWDSNLGKNYIVLFKVQTDKKEDLDRTDCTGFILPRQSFIGWST